MRTSRIIVVSLLLAIAAWAVFTWPLPRYVTSGIPSSSQNVEKDHVRRMIPGDHLQLLYHFWLFADMLRGATPWFYDLYELNLGDDLARQHRTAGFFPFFVFYAAGEVVAGRAFGYNFASFLTVWLLIGFTAFLVRRYTARPDILWAATLIGSLLPYRWATLLGGSPSGFSLMWIPLFLLGLDGAVRDFRVGGGLLALAVALLMSLSDMHAFFFAMLLAPFWCALALATHPAFNRRAFADYARLARALSPLLALLLLGALYQLLWRARTAGTALPSARPYAEVALYSPSAAGFLSGRAEGPSSFIYLGLPLLIVLGAGLLAAVAAAWRGGRDEKNCLALLALLGLALFAVGALALGTNGPFRGLLLVAARKLVPPYRMLRQPTKIFVLMPSLLAVTATLSLESVGRLIARPRARSLLPSVAALIVLLDFRSDVRPTVCLLDREQGAYRAVAEYADAEGRIPRALVLPLWPGDAIHSSPYLYYATLYRLRMVNGYYPLLSRAYLDEVRRLLPINQGYLPDEEADRLLARGIDALLLHEDAYPESVSPFPVCVTLDRLLSHPRLDPLGRDGSVWAFRILPASRARRPSPRRSPFHFPARRWEAEAYAAPGLRRTRDHGGEWAALEPGAGRIQTSPCLVVPTPDLRWVIRARGCGQLVVETVGAPTAERVPTVRVDSKDWTWAASPLPEAAMGRRVQLALSAQEGSLDVDLALLAAGDWPALEPGGSLRLPADRFFHAGYSDWETGEVHLRAEYEPSWIVFYGPKLPFEEGEYEIALDFSSAAAAGTEIARVNLRLRAGDPVRWHPVRAGEPWRLRFVQEESLPVSLEMFFTRQSDMTVSAVVLTRVQ